MKNVEIGMQKNGVEFTVTFTAKKDHPKSWWLERQNELIEKARKGNPGAEVVEVYITTKPLISKDKLMEIGQDVASGWGAVCTGVKTYSKTVVFECNEFGEKFITQMSYEDIKKEYAAMI